MTDTMNKLKGLRVGDFIERVEVSGSLFKKGEVLEGFTVQTVKPNRVMLTKTVGGKVEFKTVNFAEVEGVVVSQFDSSDFKAGSQVDGLTYEDKGEKTVFSGYSILSVYKDGILTCKQVNETTTYKKFLYRQMVGE